MSKSCNRPCTAEADISGKIEIVGEGLRAALAELFMVGGTLELGLAIKVDADCGCVDSIIIKAIGDAVAEMGC